VDQESYSQGYQLGYQQGYQAAQAESLGIKSGDYPFTVVAQYPERSSRLYMLFMIFKYFLLIPHFFVLWALSVGFFFVVIIAWWAVVIFGRYPRGLWDFMVGFYRWQLRVFAYFLGLTDKYPPFSLT
jgi:hypothetical protein